MSLRLMRATRATAIRAKALLRIPRTTSVMPGQKRAFVLPRTTDRHARACPGHPRPCFVAAPKNVDGRDIGAKQSFVASPGHDAEMFMPDPGSVPEMSGFHPAVAAVMPGQKREARLRARCPGHPRPTLLPHWGGRTKLLCAACATARHNRR